MTNDYEFVSAGNKTLIASKGFLKKEFLSSDLETLISQRAAFVQNAPIPAGVSENSRRTAIKAWSQLKTQIYAPEGQITTRWSTPDRWPHKNM